MTINSKTLKIHEDWVSVLIGGVIIVVVLFGLVSPVPEFNWAEGNDLLSNIVATPNLHSIAIQFLFATVFAITGCLLTGRSFLKCMIMFSTVYLLTLLALILAGNSAIKSVNLEAVIFSLALGLLIGNLFNLPDWFRKTLATELFVKIGLVLLGTGVIFSDILKAGSMGLLQSLIVVLSVWYFAFWLCRKMRIDEELRMMIASAVSICGVSAAIATSGAIKGDSKKLSYVISMVLITAIPMMIFMPYLAKYLGLSQEETGAWLGGSIDTTGAVVASGSLVGETALKISTIVKFSQNVLLGIAAFAISIYWTYRKNPATGDDLKPGIGVIWERFPKFVLGFILASLIFSFLLNAEIVGAVKGSLKSLQGLWFALAFTSIGLETNFKDLLRKQGRKPFYAFLIAQLFNVIITLLVAVWLFD